MLRRGSSNNQVALLPQQSIRVLSGQIWRRQRSLASHSYVQICKHGLMGSVSTDVVRQIFSWETHFKVSGEEGLKRSTPSQLQCTMYSSVNLCCRMPKLTPEAWGGWRGSICFLSKTIVCFTIATLSHKIHSCRWWASNKYLLDGWIEKWLWCDIAGFSLDI